MMLVVVVVVVKEWLGSHSSFSTITSDRGSATHLSSIYTIYISLPHA